MIKTAAHKLALARLYKAEHRDLILAWQRKYNAGRLADPVRRAKKLLQDKESRKRNYAKRRAYDEARESIKVRARSTVRNRIYRGTLKRLPCKICGNPKSHAHHHDYSKPLEIQWLCPKHHKQEHQP